MFRNIIWDVDGTLFDTYPAITKAFRLALNDFGKDVPLDLIEGLAKKSVSICASALAEKYGLDENQIGDGFVEHYDQMKAEDQPPFPGVIETCQYICSIGGENVIITHRRREGTVSLLTAHKMSGYFAGFITGDDNYPRKPDPSAFEAILKIHNLQVDETLTVGDRDIDIQAGHAAGIFTCYYGSDSEMDADLKISNFDELYDYLVSQRV